MWSGLIRECKCLAWVDIPFGVLCLYMLIQAVHLTEKWCEHFHDCTAGWTYTNLLLTVRQLYLQALDRSYRFCFCLPSIGSDLLCAGEVPVPYMADCAGGELGALCAILRLHRAVQRTRVHQRHCELWLWLFGPNDFYFEITTAWGTPIRFHQPQYFRSGCCLEKSQAQDIIWSVL